MGFSSSIALDSLYPVGSFYYTTAAECPIAALGVGTWVNVGTSLIMTVNTNVPCKGNGKATGFQTIKADGTTARYGATITTNNALGWSSSSYGQNLSSSSYSADSMSQSRRIAITDNATNSGIVGTVTRGVLTLNIFQRQA